MITVTKESRTKGALRRTLPFVLALMLVMTMGFLPTGESHASGPGFKGANIPKAYKSGYNVYHCIDISAWQGEISKSQFRTLKKRYGITHVIVRVGYTTQSLGLRFADNYYKDNINNAYAAGLKVGAYWYSQAIKVKEAQKEAKKTVKLLKKFKGKITLPVVFDWEFGGRLNSGRARANGAAYNKKICDGFCKTVKNAGYEPMVYANLSTLNGYLPANLHKSWKIWLAQYSRNCDYNKPMAMWQYSSAASFGKSLTNTTLVDINYYFEKKKTVDVTKGKWVMTLNNGKYRYKVGKEYLKSQWLTLDGKKYYLDKNGYRVTGYHKIGNYYYGFRTEGNLKTLGSMYKNTTARIDGKKYRFLKNGRSVLYTAKVVNVPDGELNYRTEPTTSGSTVMGHYNKGDVIDIVRSKGHWKQAGNGYWSLGYYDGTKKLKKLTVYPQ